MWGIMDSSSLRERQKERRRARIYSVALDGDVHYPAGIPDDIRYSFHNNTEPPAPFAKKIA